MIVLRARTATLGTNLLIEPLNGAAQSIEAGAYVNQLAWYTDAELESGRVDLNALAIRYRAFGGLYKEVQPTLYAEAQRFRDVAERLKTASQQQAVETQKRATDFLALRFDPAKSGTRDEVAGLVHEADELTRLVPAQAAQIAQAAAPIREILAKLDAGQTFFEGQWRPGSEAAIHPGAARGRRRPADLRQDARPAPRTLRAEFIPTRQGARLAGRRVAHPVH